MLDNLSNPEGRPAHQTYNKGKEKNFTYIVTVLLLLWKNRIWIIIMVWFSWNMDEERFKLQSFVNLEEQVFYCYSFMFFENEKVLQFICSGYRITLEANV